jgi:hypothetical protein
MNEKELENKRKEFRENELQNKIESYSKVSAVEFRQHTLKSNYTRRVVDRRFPKYAWAIVLIQAFAITFYSSLYVLSYVPKTKSFVAKVMP